MKSSDGRWGAPALVRDLAVHSRDVLMGTGQGREKTKPFLTATCLSSSQASLLCMLKSPSHHGNVEKYSVKRQRLLHMSNKHHKDSKSSSLPNILKEYQKESKLPLR